MSKKNYLVFGGHYDQDYFSNYDEALESAKERVECVENGSKNSLTIYKLVAEVNTKAKTSEIVKH